MRGFEEKLSDQVPPDAGSQICSATYGAITRIEAVRIDRVTRNHWPYKRGNDFSRREYGVALVVPAFVRHLHSVFYPRHK